MNWTRAVLISLLAAAALTAYNVRYPNYDPDQHIFGCMLLKDKNPDLFQKDFFFGDSRYYDYYVPWYRAVAALAVGGTEGEELLKRYTILVFPAALFFLLGCYALFWHLTECEAASWAAALAALTARANLSACAFGIGLAQSMYAYKLFYAGVPWVFYILLRFRFSLPSACAAFFLLGLVSNFHPILGVGLATILAVTLVFLNHPSSGRLRGAAGGLAAFAVGFLPFAVTYIQASAPAAVPLTADEFWRAFSTDWGYFPILWKGLQDFLLDSGALIIFSGIVLRKTRRDTDRFFTVFSAAILAVTFIEAAGLQLQSRWMNSAPMVDLEPLRSTAFLYIPLFAWTAVFLADVLHKKLPAGRLSGAALFLIAALLLFAQKEFPLRQTVRDVLVKNELYSVKRTVRLEEDQRRWKDLMELSAWARLNSPMDALFFDTHYDFRFHAQRAIVVGYKDGSMIARVGGAVKVREWLERKRTVEEAIQSKDVARVYQAARLYGCDYVVLRKGQGPSEMPGVPIFENKTYRVYKT